MIPAPTPTLTVCLGRLCWEAVLEMLPRVLPGLAQCLGQVASRQIYGGEE